MVRIFDAKTIMHGGEPKVTSVPVSGYLVDLLPIASQLLEIDAKRVFSANGAEYSLWWSVDHVQQGIRHSRRAV